VNTAAIAGVRAVVYVRNKKPGAEVVEIAKARDIPLLTTPYSMFVACGRVFGNGITGLDGSR